MLSGKRAFTLVELLIAFTVLALAAVVVQGTFRTLMFSLEAARSRAEVSRSAGGVMWVLSEELYNTVFSEGFEFYGTGEAGEPAVEFWTAYAVPAHGERGLYRVSYSAREGDLWKSVDEHYFRAASGIESFGLSFFDGYEWLDEWDSSERGGPPRAARLRLEAGGREFVKTCPVPVNAGPVDSRGRGAR